MSVISEINEDIECLKYVFKHGTLNGITIRLARMMRMMFFTTLIISILILVIIR